MNSADVLTLEEVGVAELLAHADHWAEPSDFTAAQPNDVGPDEDALDRLEQLGLVVRSPRSSRGGALLTPAGVEALAYLVTSR